MAAKPPRFGTAPQPLHADTHWGSLIEQGYIAPHSPQGFGPAHEIPDEPPVPKPKPTEPPKDRARRTPGPPPVPPEPIHVPRGVTVPDWRSMIASLGIPDIEDLSDQEAVALSNILIQKGDPAVIRNQALAYLRGTAWHARHFPGFAAGYSAGLFGDEAGYKVWRQQANTQFKAHYGRDMTVDEMTQFLTSGYTPDVIGQIGSGHSYIEANKGDIQYVEGAFDKGQLTPEELKAYGEEVTGRHSDLGARVQARIQQAQQKMQRVFEGVVASSPTQLPRATQPGQRPDVAA